MLARTRQTTHNRYKNYGGRGIKVCDRWLKFQNFYDDMGARPLGTSLDRIDNNGDYEPSNCKWADAVTQSNHRTDNTYIQHEGATLSLADWARQKGINHKTLSTRLNRGWSIERLFSPISGRQKSG